MHSPPESPEDPEKELTRLSAQKLLLEIRELSAPWWHRPSYMAAVASILGATLGLFWAISSGYFDVSRKELELKRQILLAETGAIQARLHTLEESEKKLQERIGVLDSPVLLDGYVSRAPSDFAALQTEVRLYVTGANLGEKSGSARVDCVLVCNLEINGHAYSAENVHPVPSDGDQTTISRWSDEMVELVFWQPLLKKHFSDTFANAFELQTNPTSVCEFEAIVHLVRADGKEANPREVVLTGTARWARPSRQPTAQN